MAADGGGNQKKRINNPFHMLANSFYLLIFIAIMSFTSAFRQNASGGLRLYSGNGKLGSSHGRIPAIVFCVEGQRHMKVLKAVPDEDSPEPRLRALKAQRSALAERIAGLTEARQRLDGAQGNERAGAAALSELDAAEGDAARKWASTGAVGAAPSGEIGRRTKLVANLASAQAAAAAARGACAGLEAELAGL